MSWAYSPLLPGAAELAGTVTDIAGSTSITFTASATPTWLVDIAGTTSITFTPTATIEDATPIVDLAGSTGITFTCTATVENASQAESTLLGRGRKPYPLRSWREPVFPDDEEAERLARIAAGLEKEVEAAGDKPLTIVSAKDLVEYREAVAGLASIETARLEAATRRKKAAAKARVEYEQKLAEYQEAVALEQAIWARLMEEDAFFLMAA